jgi:hypothetical protein
MAATQSLNARTRAARFSLPVSRILGAALLSTALVSAPVCAEPAVEFDLAPLALDAARLAVTPAGPAQAPQTVEPAKLAAVSHPLAPLSAAGVVAAASMQSASLIATGPLGASTALLRQRKPGRLEGQVQLLAATIFAEARSEGVGGMRCVAHVIQNRVGPRFGRTMAEVIMKPWQFSAWNRGDPNRKIALNPERYARSAGDRAAWAAAQSIAREVVEGRSVDPTGGALFYHTRAVRPHWASTGVGKRVIGQHIFYRDVRG